MSFSSLYSSILRGNWFISFKEIEMHQIVIHKMLEKDVSAEDTSILSDKKPLCIFMSDGKEAKAGKDFNDAPANSVAIIPIHGTMLKYGTYCSYGTSEIAAKIDEAVSSDKISSIVLDIDSGGGSVDAIAPLVTSIKNAQKNNKAVVACCDLCASAAYYVACHCDEIVASNNISSEFGSIGVMMSFMDYAKYYEENGVKEHVIYSSLSDYKNKPFELAKQGDYGKIIEEELDPLAKGFQDTVKHTRGNKLDTKIEGILAGRMFYAAEAKKNGLIDSVGTMQMAINRSRDIRRDAVINEYIHSKN